MNNQVRITYYDVLKRKNPRLFDFVSNDLEKIKEKGLTDPFSSTDEYSEYYESYYQKTFKDLDDFVINDLMAKSNVPYEIAEEQFSYFKNSEEYKNKMYSLSYSTHAEYLSVKNFELCGKKTFFFDNNLVDHLALTDLRTLSEYIKLPFKSCLFIYNSELMIESLHKILKSESSDINYNTPVSIFINSLKCDEGLRTIVFACWHGNYGFIKRQLLVKENWSILDMLKTDWSEIYKNNNSLIEKADFKDETVFYNEGLLFFRVLINSILYLSSNDADIIEELSQKEDLSDEKYSRLSKKKRDRIKNKNKRITELNYCDVGRNIGTIVVDKKNQNVHNTDKNNRSNLRKYIKFMVRGHWRNQPYGKKLEHKKMIWIKPYFKGNEMAELINKNYEVK